MKKCLWTILLAVLMLQAGCGQEPVTVAPPATPLPERTSAPAAGHTSVTILADGMLQAVQPALPLAFEQGGRLLAVHVQAGDAVQAGDLVATLDDTHAQAELTQAQLGLQLAELALADLTGEPDVAALAAARAGLASARANLTALTSPPSEQRQLAAKQVLSGAQQALQDLLDLPDPDLVEIARTNLTAAEMQVQAAQAAYDEVAHLEFVGMTPQAFNLWQATTSYEQARAQYNQALKGATAEQLAAARAQVALAQADLDALQQGPDPDALAAAQAQVDQAQATLDGLLAGPPAGEVTRAEIGVAQARLALESAQRRLDGTELRAPSSGTVESVQAAPGALVGGGVPIVVLLDTTGVEFHTLNLSERDLGQVAPGQAATVTLKAFADDPIEATVVRIGLEASGTVGDAAIFPVVLAFGETELDLRPGMTGRAEIQAGE